MRWPTRAAIAFAIGASLALWAALFAAVRFIAGIFT